MSVSRKAAGSGERTAFPWRNGTSDAFSSSPKPCSPPLTWKCHRAFRRRARPSGLERGGSRVIVDRTAGRIIDGHPPVEEAFHARRARRPGEPRYEPHCLMEMADKREPRSRSTGRATLEVVDLCYIEHP